MRIDPSPLLTLVVVGCGRIAFEQQAAEVQPACSWTPAPVFVGPPEVLALSTTAPEGDPTLSSDFLELFWASNGIHHAVRATRESPFVETGGVAGLELVTGELNGFSLSRDGLTAYFARRVGTTADLYTASRTSRDGAFGVATPIAELATASHEFNPRVSPDDRTIVYVHWEAPDDASTADAFLAHRATSGEAWSDAERAGYSTPMPDAASSFIADTRTVVFETAGDLFVAHRADDASPFEPAVPLSINTASFDGLPFAAADGCELFFVSDRPGGVGALDLYRAVVEP